MPIVNTTTQYPVNTTSHSVRQVKSDDELSVKEIRSIAAGIFSLFAYFVGIGLFVAASVGSAGIVPAAVVMALAVISGVYALANGENKEIRSQ
jgi:hypothetical protein